MKRFFGKHLSRTAFLTLVSTALAGPNTGRAEEGMWTFDHLPIAAMQSAYHLSLIHI